MGRKRNTTDLCEVALFSVPRDSNRLTKAERRGAVAAIECTLFNDAPELSTEEYTNAYNALKKLRIKKKYKSPASVYGGNT